MVVEKHYKNQVVSRFGIGFWLFWRQNMETKYRVSNWTPLGQQFVPMLGQTFGAQGGPIIDSKSVSRVDDFFG